MLFNVNNLEIELNCGYFINSAVISIDEVIYRPRIRSWDPLTQDDPEEIEVLEWSVIAVTVCNEDGVLIDLNDSWDYKGLCDDAKKALEDWPDEHIDDILTTYLEEHRFSNFL